MKHILSQKMKLDWIAKFKALEEENQRLRNLLLTDALTGLGSPSSFFSEVTKLVNEVKSDATVNGSLIFIDVDHFRAINLEHGHLAASHLLRLIGRRMGRLIREGDAAFRYGGDEFVILVRGDLERAKQIGERLRLAIADKTFEIEGFKGRQKVGVTVSLGARSIKTGDTAEILIQEADSALFEAKRISRNILVAA